MMILEQSRRPSAQSAHARRDSEAGSPGARGISSPSPGFPPDFVYLSFSYHSFNPLSPHVEILFVREGFDFKSMRG